MHWSFLLEKDQCILVKTSARLPATYHSFSIVPLQTRDALNEEVSKQGLNIIQSVSFPTDQNPQPFVQKLQVGDGNEMDIMIIILNAMKYEFELPWLFSYVHV